MNAKLGNRLRITRAVAGKLKLQSEREQTKMKAEQKERIEQIKELIKHLMDEGYTLEEAKEIIYKA